MKTQFRKPNDDFSFPTYPTIFKEIQTEAFISLPNHRNTFRWGCIVTTKHHCTDAHFQILNYDCHLSPTFTPWVRLLNHLWIAHDGFLHITISKVGFSYWKISLESHSLLYSSKMKPPLKSECHAIKEVVIRNSSNKNKLMSLEVQRY